jgi:hypothetical protein
MPAFAIQRAAGAEEIRPVPILESWAGLAKSAFPAIASLALRSKAFFKRLGRGSQSGTHDKQADEQRDSHGALHVD